jgi:hypothetical protein
VKTLLLLTMLATPVAATEAPYSCRLLYAEQSKCSMEAKCDQRVLDRLRRECLRDGGRP